MIREQAFVTSWRLKGQSGFSLTEMFVAFAVLGIVMLLIVPKLLKPNDEDRQTAALVRDSFAAVGEMYMAREQDSTYPAEAIGTSERKTFGQYLYAHLNYLTAVNPAGVADYCTTGNYFALQGGATITNICDVANPQMLTIAMSLPDPENSSQTITSYTLVIPATNGKGSPRYTTMYGMTGVAANCNSMVDPILHIVDACP